MAIGVTSPLVLAALLRRPDFAASKRFLAWNLSGILDLTVAVSIGALVPLLAPNLYGAVSTAPMTQLPLVLVPTFLVPTFLILHLTALFQARRLAATSIANLMGKSGASGEIRISQTA
jgi:xanthine/uracil permease